MAQPSAFLLCAMLGVTAAAPAVSQEQCKPILSPKVSGHSEVVNFRRKWTAVFAVDASGCATSTGPFEIAFVRLKDFAPDLSFRERYAWMTEDTDVSLDLTWDEWIDSYRIGDVAPCPCRR
jgi:hypothetical protein